MRPLKRLFLVGVLVITMLNSHVFVGEVEYGVRPARAEESCIYFPETRHYLCHGFLSYWRAFGGLPIFGYPLTDEFVDPATGRVTQWFERARFEWHPGTWPERYDVLLGLLGSELSRGRETEEPFLPAQPVSGCAYFSETGHNLCGRFRFYWERFGGLPIFGYPISEEFVEINPDTRQPVLVQYFERQRFEYHPGSWPERLDILLGRLGAQVLEEPRPRQPAPSPAPPPPTPTPSPQPPPTLTPGPTPTPVPSPTPPPFMGRGWQVQFVLPGGWRALEGYARYGQVDVVVAVGRDGVAVADIQVLFQVSSGPNQTPSWVGRDRTRWGTGYAYWTYSGTRAGRDIVEACADVNRNGNCDAGEARASRSVWVGVELTVTFSTGSATQVRTEPLDVLARLTLGGQPWANRRVVFHPLRGSPWVRMTDAAGQASVTVTQENGDFLTVCLDENQNGQCDGDDVFRQGWYISWTEPRSYSFGVYPLRAALPLGGNTTITAWLRQGTTGAAGVPVLWRVFSGPGAFAGWQPAGTTNGPGQVNWTFRAHASESGIARLEACADLNRSEGCDAAEPQATTDIWVGYEDALESSTEAQVFGESVQVRYRATLGGRAVPDLPVLFEVRPPQGISVNPVSATDETDSDGVAEISLTAQNTMTDPSYRWVEVVACADLNRSGRCDGGIEVPAEPQRSLFIGWGFSSEVRLSPWPGPAFAYLRAGQDERQFTVTVELVDPRNNVWGGVAGQQVVAAATGANAWSGVSVSTQDGTATFSYRGSEAGEDRLVICLDSNENGMCEATEQTIAYWRTVWVSSVTVSYEGAAVDEVSDPNWTAGDTAVDLQLVLQVSPHGISAPLIVELTPAADNGATVGFDPTGAVRSTREWTSSSGVSLSVYVVTGAPGRRFIVKVWLDRFEDGLATGDPLVSEVEITLTE
ncbi:hypothetical protein HRbin28_01232 [bacterium HR28]|nr:hypothetical protein HRbin28_01232 [bacterium HR28]